MNPLKALSLVAKELGSRPATVVQENPWIGLPDNVAADMRALLAPVQALGLPLEPDPVIPHTVATMLEGRLFRISVVTSPGGAQRVAVLGPDLVEWERDAFLALLPEEPAAAPPPAPVRVSTQEIARPQAAILEDILATLRAIEARLP